MNLARSSSLQIDSRVSIIIYVIGLICIPLVFLNQSISPPYILGVVFLSSLYLFTLTIGRTLSKAAQAALILSLSVALALIVIDPTEIGLYGYDPYTFSLPAAERILHTPSLSAFMSDGGSWPLLYILYNLLVDLTGSSGLTVAKYMPIISVGVPLFVFLYLDIILDNKLAFVGGMVTVGTRTLFLFEVKFIEETIAVVLFSVLLYSTANYSSRSRFWLASLVSLALLFSHPAVALFAIILVGTITYVPRIASKFPQRFSVIAKRTQSQKLFLLLALGFICILLYITSPFTERLGYVAIRTFSKSYTGLPSPGSRSNKIITVMLFNSLIGGLAIFLLYAYITEHRFTSWQLSLSVYSGLLTIGYFFLSWFPSILDSSRIVIFFAPILVIVAISIIEEISAYTRRITIIPVIGTLLLFALHLRLVSTLFVLVGIFGIIIGILSFTSEYSRLIIKKFVISFIIITFFLTQVTSIPPHVIYSDPGETTLGEGHYTTSQFSASGWTSRYSNKPVVGYESGLWTSNDNSFVYYKGYTTCEDQLVMNRIEAPHPVAEVTHTIFDSGSFYLSYC